MGTASTIALPVSLPRLTEAVAERLAGGGTGVQLYASLGGEVVVDTAAGEAAPGVPMCSDHLVRWASATKVLTAVAIGQVWEQGLVALDDRVSRFIPEYAQQGKDGITLRHLLTHTSGLVDLSPTTFEELDHDECLARICAQPTKPGWVRGRMASYGGSGLYLLGEVVSRVAGVDYATYLRRHVLEPLGAIDSWVGMPEPEYERYRAAGTIADAVAGDEAQLVARWASVENAQAAARCNPGGGGRGPMSELASVYEMLLGHGERRGARLLSPATVEAIWSRHRVGMGIDVFNGHVLDLGLLLYINSAHYGPRHALYGDRASPRAAGHGGAGGVWGFCDPEFALAIAFYAPGPRSGVIGGGALTTLVDALYEDLDLAAPEAPSSSRAGQENPTT